MFHYFSTKQSSIVFVIHNIKGQTKKSILHLKNKTLLVIFMDNSLVINDIIKYFFSGEIKRFVFNCFLTSFYYYYYFAFKLCNMHQLEKKIIEMFLLNKYLLKFIIW